MNLKEAQTLLPNLPAVGFDVFERETGDCQVALPILHEDGDMVDIYLQDSPRGAGYVRICDFGMALMRLSYTYDLDTPTRQAIFRSILHHSGVGNDDGSLYLDAPADALYAGILQFAGCVQKVCNMRYWDRETVRRAYQDDRQAETAA